MIKSESTSTLDLPFIKYEWFHPTELDAQKEYIEVTMNRGQRFAAHGRHWLYNLDNQGFCLDTHTKKVTHFIITSKQWLEGDAKAIAKAKGA